MIDFVNIHTHSNLGSMLDSLISVNDLFNRAKEFGQKAIAITDHGTLAAHYDAFQAYKKTGVKFIPGIEMYFVNSYDVIENKTGKGRKKTEKRKHIVLLAKNHIGYKNLLKINYIGFQNQVIMLGKSFARVNWEVLEKYSEGIICTSACVNGIVANLLLNNDYDGACKSAQRLNSIFKSDFYIEIQPHLLKNEFIDQHSINLQLIDIAKKFNIPLVVGVDVHYLDKNSEKYHDVLLAVKEKIAVDDQNRHRYGIDEFYVKSGEEIHNFLSNKYGKDIADEAISNTVKIADLCDPPDYMEVKGNHLPIFNPKNEPDYQKFLNWKTDAKLNGGLKEDAEYMRFKIFNGFNKKFKSLSRDEVKIRLKRIKDELKILEGNDFSSYMLIVSDFIRWSKTQGILIGCGRGSCGGSLIAYLLDIHNVDPLEYGLIFERFQNAYKKDLPDIDTDFTSAGRDIVQKYCREKYGYDHCAQVSNINKYSPKSVIPNLVKSMRNTMPNLIKPGENYVKLSNTIKDLIPEKDKDGKDIETLEQAISLSPQLKELADKCPDLMDYADKLIGLPKEFSTHAAGMVISDIPIVEFAPVRIDKNGIAAVQYEKNRCESIGLVKMDFLALSTLDVIDETIKNIRKTTGNILVMEEIPLDDKETYKMIQDGQTKCVFQLGTSSMMISLCKSLKPQNIVDIAVINALGRPSSSKEEREEYIARRFGNKKITYLHPSLENSLKETYGLCVFEEQMMYIAKDLAGWDLSKADGLRKLTKLKGKNPKIALQLENDFINGIIETHNLSYERAKELWDKIILPWAGYGFNKSHAVQYSINSYYTAFLKRHFPAEFFAAYLKIKTNMGGIHKDIQISMAKNECKKFNIRIIPPDINNSGSNYEVLDRNTIVMGLSAIKGLGEKGIVNIVKNQPYSSFSDFLLRTEGRVINKLRMEALAKSGCFDKMNIARKDIFESGKKNRDKFNLWIKKNYDGYGENVNCEEFPLKFENVEWSIKEKLQYEMEVFGELISGNLGDLYPGFFTGVGTTFISQLKSLPNRHNIVVEFLVIELMREFKISKGKYIGQKMIKYRVCDINGAESELTVWPTEYDSAKRLMKDGAPIRAQCQTSDFNGVKTLMLRSIEKIYKNT